MSFPDHVLAMSKLLENDRRSRQNSFVLFEHKLIMRRPRMELNNTELLMIPRVTQWAILEHDRSSKDLFLHPMPSSKCSLVTIMQYKVMWGAVPLSQRPQQPFPLFASCSSSGLKDLTALSLNFADRECHISAGQGRNYLFSMDNSRQYFDNSLGGVTCGKGRASFDSQDRKSSQLGFLRLQEPARCRSLVTVQVSPPITTLRRFAGLFVRPGTEESVNCWKACKIYWQKFLQCS